ncbi:MAG: cryptochrome/photolyase family protein [Gammaproteobacteria bacterium]
MRGLYWFRNDLRVEDNAALFEASQQCHDGILAVYCIPYETWRKHHMAGCKVDFILRHLPSLAEALSKLNIPLHIEIHKTYRDSAQKIAELASLHKVQAVYCNREYEWDERQRDLLLTNLLAPDHITLHTFDESVIVPPGKVFTGKGSPYTVFTPFKKAALLYLSRPGTLVCTGMPAKQKNAFASSSPIPTHVPGFHSDIPATLWPAGIDEAQRRLDHFLATGLDKYQVQRDYPNIDGTSKLSPYLHIGAISVKRCYELGQASPTWISELLWRDFYKQISFHFPHVCKGKSFHLDYDKMKWDHDEKAINAWKAGETGYPFVDAAMKQLVQTGWMHNRLRMLVAMFFCKLMYQDWRIGEKFFMEHLIDGDFSSNNGGWQWSSATGTDAAPYFRIFNPRRQSEEFDADGTFIRQYLPILKDLSARDIHAPPSVLAKEIGYPAPLLEYEKARKLSLSRFLAFKKETR